MVVSHQLLAGFCSEHLDESLAVPLAGEDGTTQL